MRRERQLEGIAKTNGVYKSSRRYRPRVRVSVSIEAMLKFIHIYEEAGITFGDGARRTSWQ